MSSAMNTPFRYLVVASPLHDDRARDAIAAAYRRTLTASGGTPATGDDWADPAPLVYVILTGGTEQEVLRLRSLRAAALPGEPALLLAHPGHNSLPAALEILARIHQDGQPGRIIFLSGPSDESGLESLAAAVRATDAAAFLRRARIGVVGPPSDWLVASVPEPTAVRRLWGPILVGIPLDRVHERLAAGAPGRSWPGRPRTVVEPTPADLDRSAAIYEALREIAADHRLDALTIRCFDLVTTDRATGCLALARLSDEGIPAGCEGDVPSVLGLLWIHRLTGRPGWMANPARVDPAAGRLLLAHCTVPLDLVEGHALRSHFESGLGAAIQGELPAGDATLLRIGGAELDRLWIAEGTGEAGPPEEGLCRTQLTVRVPPAAAAELLARPLGNHLLYAPGRWRSLLETGASLQGSIQVSSFAS